MNDDKLKKAYQSALKYYDLPDFETFKSDMMDENNLRKFRDNLSKHYDIPDFNTFKSDMGIVKKKETTVSPSVQKEKPISSGTQPKATQKPSGTSVSQKETKPEILFPAQKGKRNDVFTTEDGKTYRLDMSSGRPVWKGYTSSVVKGQGGSKQDYEIYNSAVTDPATVNLLNQTFNKKASTSEAEQIFTGYQGKEENEYRIRNGVWQRKQKGQDNWVDLYSQGSISALNKEFGQKVKYDAARDKFSGSTEDVQLKEKKYLDQNINSINSKLIGQEEEDVVNNLRKKFPGFTFNQAGTFTDEIKVQAPNGEFTTISLDNWTDDDDNAQAQKLRGFIRTNSSKELASATSTLDETEKENEIKSGININMRRAKPGDKEYISGVAENMQPYVQNVSFVSKEEKYKTEAAEKAARKEYAKQTSLVFADVYDRQKQSLKEGSKIDDKEVIAELAALPKSNDAIRRANEYANDVNKSFKSYNSKIEQLSRISNDVNQKLQNGEISEEEFNQVYKPQIEAMSNDIKTMGDNLKIDATNLTNIDRSVNESVAKQYIIDEAQGSLAGGLAYKFAKGMTYIPRLISPDMTKEDQEALVRSIVGGGTTKQYMESEKRSDITKALFSLSESMGALASGAALGGGPATYAAFYGQSYYEMKDDLDQVKDMSDASKVLMSSIYGAASSVLEKFGIDFAMQKTGVGKNLTNSIMKAVFSNLPKNASKEFIEASIMNNAKRFLIQSGIQTGGAGIVEGATEGLQALTQVGIKEVYDLANKTDYFNNKSGWEILGDIAYESYLGALGGGIMGTVSQSKSIIDRGVNVALNKDQLDVLFNTAKIDGIPEALLTNLKSSIITGKISQKEAQDIYNSYNDVKSKIQSIPEEYSIENKSVALDLMLEKDRINKQIAGRDANLVKPQMDRIAEIDNQLKTIGENAVKESTKPVEEGPAEGGGIQYQGTQEGQPEVREGERPVGKTAQPSPDLGNRPVEGRGVQEETRVTRQVVNRPAVLSEFGGKTFDTPLKGDVYVEGQQVVFEDRSTGRVYELGNVDEVMDTQVPGLSVEQERVSITPEGKVSIEGGNWNIQSELPTQGIEYNPAGEVMTVSLKDDAGNTKMFKGQDAVDIAYQIELQKYQTEEQQQLINNLLEQDEEFQAATENIKPAEVAAVVQEEAAPDIVPTEPTVAEETINKEVDALEKLLKRQDPNFQLDSEITQEEKKEELVSKAIDKMSKSDISEMSEEAFEAEFPTPDVKTYPIEVKENSELASKLKRMGLKDLIGKKINLVMADQLKVGEVMGKKRMGGPFFPLIDKLFGKVAWASIDETAAKRIINGATKSDYTVVYNMNPSAIDSNAAITETFEDLITSLPKNKQKQIFSAIQEQVLKNKYAKKTDQVRAIAKSSKTLNDFFTELDKLDVDTISAVVKNIMPSRNVDAATRIGKLLQNENITIESIREMNVEQFASKLPAGALTMVLEITDKSGNKVTKNTASEALITPDQQDAEGLPRHSNYPIYVRGKAIAMLNETVPFWNILKGSINNINVKIAGIVRQASGRKITSKEAMSNEMRSASMTASVAKKVSEKINTQYNRFVSAISKSFPNVEVVASQEEFDALLNDLNTKKLSTKNAKVYGAVYKGKLYLNPSLENYNTPVHEFGHIWINTAKVASKELYNKGISLVKGSEYESNVRNNKEYQRVIKQMKADGASDIDIDNYIYEEALATAIGDKGESFVTASQRLDFKNWMRKLFSFVKSMTGISKYTSEQLEDITLDEFVQAVSVDIMSGTELFKGAKTNLSDALQLMTNGSNSIEYIMSVARDNGISDAAIKKYLSNQGFSEQEIKSAFKKQPKAPSVEKILGKPAPKKMIVNEAVALRDQLRLEARAARESAMDLKRKQRALVAVVNGMKRSGSINTTQATALAKRIVNTNIDNPVMVKRMLDYAGRLFQDAEYKNKLSNARSINKKIKSAIKSKDLQASVVAVAKDFSKIDPRLLEDIDRYIENATKVLDAVKRTRLPEMREAMNFDDINAYTEEANAEMEEYRKEEVKELNDQLLESIDTEGMTAAELMDLIRSLSDVDAALPSEKKRAIILDYINKVKDAYTPIVESIVKGTDPFTGDSIDTSKKAKELIGKLIDIDINKLDVREAVKVIDAINNFITNGITDNVESIVRTYEGQVNAQEIADSNMPIREAKLGGIARLWSEQMMNLPVLADWIFKSPKRAIQVLNKMGFTDFQNGVAKAVKNWTNYVDSYHNTFKKKKANGKNFMDAENIYERGVYAFLKRTVAGDEIAQQKEFERKVGLISKSIDVLKKQGSQKDLKVAEMYEQLMDKFELNKDGVTISDVESKVDPINKDAVNWWINTWAENYGDLADVSQNVYNTVLGKDINYTPDKFSSLDVANSKQIEEMIDSMGGGGFAGSLNYEYDKKTGVLMPSSKPVSMETGRYVNLNFDMNNSRALKAALVDINTAGATKQIKGFLKSDRWNNIIKNKEDRDLFRSRVDSYILASRNKRTATDEQALAAFERTMRAWASIGATRALGGIFQPVKQVVPVMVNTAINVGRNFSLAVTRDQYSWIDKIGMPISNRGIESMAAFEDADKEFENNVAIGAYTKAMSGIEALNKKWLKLVLSNPDVFAARSSFIAYYKQALRAKGMSANIDFTKPEDADQEALNYAQHMVDRQQNVSDAALMGDLFTSNQPLKKIIKNTLFPFMSFVINQKSRMVTDLATFSSKDVSMQEKINAFKSLSALTSEMAVFHTISFAIKYYIVNAIVGAISGEEEDEEEVEKAMKRQFGYTVGTVAKDILSPVPIATDKAVESGVDYLLDIIGKSALEDEAKLALKNENIMLEDEGEDPITGEDAKKWIEKYVEDNRVKVQSYEAQGPGGVYRIAFDKFSEIYDTYKLASEGSYESEGFAGKPITKYIDEQGREDIKEILPYYAAWSALGIPAEFGTIFRKYESKIKRDNGLTEKQKESEKEVLKEYNKEKLNDLEFALVKKLKGTTTQSGAERVIEELNWIKENGGVKGDKQIKKYIEILEANGEVMYDDLKKIQSIK